jgi:hypothetical protein
MTDEYRLKSELVQAIDKMVDKISEKDEYFFQEVYFGDETIKRMADAAYSVFRASEEIQAWLIDSVAHKLAD